MEETSTQNQKALPDATGFRRWFFVALMLFAFTGPVINSERWQSWHEGRITVKVINWAINVAVALVIFFRPAPRGRLRWFRVFPWLFAFMSAFMLWVYTLGKEPEMTLLRAAYAGSAALVWFMLFKRYPFLLHGDDYSEDEWKRLTRRIKSPAGHS